MSTTVRELVATLGLKVDEGGFKQADQKFASIASSVAGLGAGIAGIFTAGGIVAAIKDAFSSINELTARLARTAPSMGLSVQNLQAWEHAASASGVSAETFGAAAEHLKHQFQAMSMGSAHATAAMAGISRVGKDGKLKDIGQLMEDVSDRVLRFKDPMNQAAEATRILGGSGAAMLPLLLKGRDGIRLLREEVKAFGADLKDEDVAAMAAYRREVSRTSLVVSGMKQSVAGPLAVIFAGVTKSFNDWVKAQKGFGPERVRDGFGQLGKYAWIGEAALRGIYNTWVTLGTYIDTFAVVAGSALAAVTAGLVLMKIPMLLAMAPWAIFLGLAAAIGLAIDDIWGMLKGGNSIIGEFFPEWARQIQTIADLFKKDDWENAFLAISKLWQEMLDRMADAAVKWIANSDVGTLLKKIAGESGTERRMKEHRANWAQQDVLATAAEDPEEAKRMKFSQQPLYKLLRGATELAQSPGVAGDILRAQSPLLGDAYNRQRFQVPAGIAAPGYEPPTAGGARPPMLFNQTFNIHGVPDDVLEKQKQRGMFNEALEETWGVLSR